MSNGTEKGSADSGLTFFTEGDDLYAAMLASIAAAQTSIQLETYIFADDEIGRRFSAALIERAKQGVDVRLQVDAAGSLFWGAHRLIRILNRQGVRVHWFHRWSWHRPLRYNRRDHRKLLVVDRELAYLGGFNIHRENSRNHVGERRWRDSHVKFHGRLASVAAELFDDFWQRRQRWIGTDNDGQDQLIPNHTRRSRRQMRAFYIQGFQQANTSIHVVTPYFIPDHVTQQALIDAAQRGVAVSLLLPGQSDVRIARWAAHAVYDRMLAAGVKIYEYLPRMLHAKTVVVDGGWTVLGTANLDYRSLFVNYELNLVSRNPSLCQQLEQQFLVDLSQADQVSMQRWAGRPLWHHVAEMIGWLVRRWL